MAVLRPGLVHDDPVARRTVARARGSRHDQRAELARQRQVFALYCASQGWPFPVLADPGSGTNDHKQGLKCLLDAIGLARMGGKPLRWIGVARATLRLNWKVIACSWQRPVHPREAASRRSHAPGRSGLPESV